MVRVFYERTLYAARVVVPLFVEIAFTLLFLMPFSTIYLWIDLFILYDATAPPYGPKTCLNRTGYGVHGGGLFGQTLERVSKMKNGPIMAGLVAGICAICYLPLGTCGINK